MSHFSAALTDLPVGGRRIAEAKTPRAAGHAERKPLPKAEPEIGIAGIWLAFYALAILVVVVSN